MATVDLGKVPVVRPATSTTSVPVAGWARGATQSAVTDAAASPAATSQRMRGCGV
jgi:hypothetical protein